MRALRFAHRWLGIVLALPLLLQGLSGAILTLEPALPHWGTVAVGAPASANAMLAAATAIVPAGMRPVRYMPPDGAGAPVRVQFAPAGQPRGPGLVVSLDPVTATPSGPPRPATGMMDWIRRLHANLLVPEWGGRQVAGWFGVGLLMLTLLGVPLWWPSRRQREAGRVRDAFTVPRGARGTRLHRRLHGAMGIWLWLMMLATSTTGIVQGFPQTSRIALGVAGGGPRSPGHDAPATPFVAPDLDAAIRLALDAAPGTRIRLAMLPAGGAEPIRLILGPPGVDGAMTATTVLVDAAGTRLGAVQAPGQASWGEMTLRAAHDLHLGQGFGPAWRGLTVLVGVALPAFGATGWLLWLSRRRNRRRMHGMRQAATQAAPQLETKMTGRRVLRGAILALLCAPCSAWAQDAGGAPVPPAATAVLPHDLSAWSMVASADWVVKAVIAGLAFASVLTWTVALAKAAELLAAGRRAKAGLAALNAAGSLDDAGQRLGPVRGDWAAMIGAARDEVAASAGAVGKEGVKERTAWRLERLVAGAGRGMGRGTGILATIGATAPFVGLFGTVWGIMNAFIGISRSQTTNLAVVAPGIAEALLTTAVGLVAAIPAVVVYNVFARAIAGQKARLADGVAGTMRLLSRDLDRVPHTRLHAAAE